MKGFVVALCLASAAAFVPRTAHLARTSAPRVASDDGLADLADLAEPAPGSVVEPVAAPEPVAAAVAALPTKSIAIPIMDRPALLDGTLAGDVGFDPLGFADNKENLQFYADAEVKHARLAMLCAAGWPVSELLHKTLANAAGLDPLLAAGGRAPSVLNGGIFDTTAGVLGLGALVGGAALVELGTNANGRGWGKTNGELKTPGDFGFDPFGLYGKTDAERKTMRTKEIKNGRAAMMGVLAYVGAEAITGKPVIDLTPLFFKPIWVVVMAMMNGDADAAAAALAAATPVMEAAAVAAPAVVEAAAPVMEAAAVAAPAAVEAAAAAAPVGDAAPAVAEYVSQVYSDLKAVDPIASQAAEYVGQVYEDLKELTPKAAEAVVQAAAPVVEAAATPAP